MLTSFYSGNKYSFDALNYIHLYGNERYISNEVVTTLLACKYSLSKTRKYITIIGHVYCT